MIAYVAPDRKLGLILREMAVYAPAFGYTAYVRGWVEEGTFLGDTVLWQRRPDCDCMNRT
jgi:hypothetical protein